MRTVRRVILQALVITVMTGLTIGGSIKLSRADSGMDSGAGGMGNQEVPDTIQGGSGSGSGGSTDTGTGSDTGSSYGRGSGVDSGTGYGNGGSTESGTGGVSGSGTGGSTVNPTEDSDSNKNVPGTFRGGVFYPDYSNELGAGSNAGSEHNR
jgi:hypothetical protein